MCRSLPYALVLLAGLGLVGSAPAQESQAAKTTRKSLQKTIDVDQKEVGTKDFFDEISSDLDGKIKFKIDNGSGVSNNTKISYKGKGVTVEKMLNDLADKNDWGWYVVSNAGNNAVDGKVVIRKSSKGKERGYEAGKDPKKASLDPAGDTPVAANFLVCRSDAYQEATSPKVDAGKKDLDQLQGDWIMAALEVNGVNVAPDKLEGSVLTIKDDGYAVKRKDTTTRCKITLDPAKDPKEIDMLFLDGDNKDRTQKGIYKITGDTFQFVRGISPDQNRPRDFATWPETNYFMVTWKKK
jgi:uncharacterized protein (TIGR03067 family)